MPTSFRRLADVETTSCVYWGRTDYVLPTSHSHYFTYLSTFVRDVSVWALFDPIYVPITTLFIEEI